MKSKFLIETKNEGKIKSAKFTKFIRNLKGFLLKKKKIISKKKNENEINESNFFKIMKDMMILGLKREDIIKYFKKEKSFRSEIETRTVADYLSANKKNIFFNTIRKISKGKLYSLVHNLTLEYYKKDDLIFLYKEPLNKFYIILEGTISLYMPYFIKKYMTIKDFLNYFFYTKNYFPKSFLRVEKKNENLFDGIYQLKVNEYDINSLYIDENQKQDFYIEEYQNVYNLYEGNQVNQISVLYNLVQNFNGYAKTDVYLLSLNKSDFMHILRVFLEEELSKKFGQLRKYCYIFNLWNNYSLAQIMNYYIPFSLSNEEIIYNQKDDSDSFYIIEDGIFEVFCEISLSEFSQYRKYVLNNNQNIIDWIKEQKENKNKISVEKILDYIQLKKKEKKYPEDKNLPDKNITYIQKNLLNEENDEQLINLKINEEFLKEKNKKIKIKLFTFQKNDFIGLEDSLELKNRLYYVKCASEKGTLNKIRLLDFIVFIASNHGLDLNNIFNYVKERKNNIIERVLKNLNIELNQSKRLISNAYSLALNSFENRKNLKLKIKTDNIYNIQYTSNLNLNEKIIQKIKETKLKNKTNTNNILDEYKDKSINSKRKKSAQVRRAILFNQLNNNNDKKKSSRYLKWDFNEKIVKETNKKKIQNTTSSYILTTSYTDRKMYKINNNNNKYEMNNNNNIDNNIDNNVGNNTDNIYYLKNHIISKSKKNLEKNIFNFTINILYNQKYDSMKNNDLSHYSKKLDKEILNMTGIYNTKREVSKKKLITPSSNETKNSKLILNNYKLSHSYYKNQKKNNRLNSEFLSIINNSKIIHAKKKRNKTIPYIKNATIRNYINK